MSTICAVARLQRRLADHAIGGDQIAGALLLAGEHVGAVGLGVGELDEHHLRAIEVIADRGLQHAPGLDVAADRGACGS